MAINLASLAPITTAATALSNLILVSPQSVVGYAPQNPPTTNNNSVSLSQTAPALLFHYEGEQSVDLESDITDHYVENNTAVQDQIALHPIVITTDGYIGELNDVAPFGLQTVKAAAEKLTAIGAYAPQLSVTAQIAYNEAFFAYQIASNLINSAVSTWSSIAGSGNGQNVVDANGQISSASVQNKQQTMFNQFYGYWVNRTLFTVQTPWAVFQNMAIKNLRAIQSEETNVITDFKVSFKQIRIASTAFGSALPVSLSGHAAEQAAPATDQGTTAGTPTSETPTSLTNQTNNPTGAQ